jgi:hypothetical protein
MIIRKTRHDMLTAAFFGPADGPIIPAAHLRARKGRQRQKDQAKDE